MEININRNKRIIKWANGIALKNFLSSVTFRGHLGFTIPLSNMEVIQL